jgi:hypothetical protein
LGAADAKRATVRLQRRQPANTASWQTNFGVAVVNSELFAETQEHLAQHRLLHHITTLGCLRTTLEDAWRAR